MREKISSLELEVIEQDIARISAELDILDPSNAIEAQQIEAKAATLRYYISALDRKELKRPFLQLVR